MKSRICGLRALPTDSALLDAGEGGRSAPFAFDTRHDWTGALLVRAVDDIDYLGEHFYGYPNLVIDADKQAFVETTDPLEHGVRRMPNKVQSHSAACQHPRV